MEDKKQWNYGSLYEGWTYWVPDKSEKEEKTLTKRCTCGIFVTMGTDVPNDFHSTWCDLREKKDDNGKTSL